MFVCGTFGLEQITLQIHRVQFISNSKYSGIFYLVNTIQYLFVFVCLTMETIASGFEELGKNLELII